MRITSSSKLRCVAGLPRCGTTLLCSALDQSPETYIEGTSGLWSILASTLQTCIGVDAEYIKGRDRQQKTLRAVLPAIVNAYYEDVPKDKIIIDKSRGWNNAHFLGDYSEYVDELPSIVFLYRPVEEIFKSFANLLDESHREDFYAKSLEPQSTIQVCVNQLLQALRFDSDCYRFVTYANFVENFTKEFADICTFFAIPDFSVDPERLSNFQKEPETTQGFKNLHRVRDGVSRQNIDIELPEHVLSFCHAANEQIELALNEVKR